MGLELRIAVMARGTAYVLYMEVMADSYGGSVLRRRLEEQKAQTLNHPLVFQHHPSITAPFPAYWLSQQE